MKNNSGSGTGDTWRNALLFVVDDVPATDRLYRGGRPAERFGVPLVADLWSVKRSMDADLNLGKAQVVMIHIGHAQADHMTKSVTLLEYISLQILDRGGWLMLFTGGDPATALQKIKIKRAFDVIKSKWHRGERFELCDFHELDPVAIREVTAPLPPDWKVENLLSREWFYSRVLERLTAAQLAGTGHVVAESTLQELQKIDVKRFERLVVEENHSGEGGRYLGELTSWLMSIKARCEAKQEVPEGFSLWVHELRRRLNHPFAPAEGEWKLFERERSRISHSLFGNEFANRLGADLDFVTGYWLSLEGSSEAGLEDQRESVEGARNNWEGIAGTLRSFFKREWKGVDLSKAGSTEVWRKSALEKIEIIQELVTCMTKLAGKPESDKRVWLEKMNNAIADMQRELERPTESLSAERVA